LRLLVRKNGCADDGQASPVKLTIYKNTLANGLESTLETLLLIRITAKITGQKAEKILKF
jgi:hypothetical protein